MGQPRKQERAYEAELNRIVLPAVAFNGARIADVVDALRRLGEKYDPEGRGVSIVLDLLTPEVRLPKANDEEENDWPSSAIADQHITLNLKNVTFLETVDAVCREADLVWRLELFVMISAESEYDWLKSQSNRFRGTIEPEDGRGR